MCLRRFAARGDECRYLHQHFHQEVDVQADDQTKRGPQNRIVAAKQGVNPSICKSRNFPY